MPALTYQGADLLESIRNHGMIPNTGATGSKDADLLRHASEGIREYLTAAIGILREEYYVWREREELTVDTAEFRIPPRSMWDKLKNLWLIRETATADVDRHRLDPLPSDNLDKFNATIAGPVPTGYVMDGVHVRLIPDRNPSYTGQIEWNYYVRPGSIVLATEARQILTVTVATKTVTFATAIPTTPTAWGTSNIFDIHSPHSGSDYKMFGQSVTAASGTSMTFTNAIDGSVFGTKALVINDWVCLENEVALPGVPADMFSLVARVAAMHWASATGNEKKFKMHAEVVNGYLDKQLNTMEVRVEEQPIRIGRRRSFLGARRWRY